MNHCKILSKDINFISFICDREEIRARYCIHVWITFHSPHPFSDFVLFLIFAFNYPSWSTEKECSLKYWILFFFLGKKKIYYHLILKFPEVLRWFHILISIWKKKMQIWSHCLDSKHSGIEYGTRDRHTIFTSILPPITEDLSTYQTSCWHQEF